MCDCLAWSPGMVVTCSRAVAVVHSHMEWLCVKGRQFCCVVLPYGMAVGCSRSVVMLCATMVRLCDTRSTQSNCAT